MRIQKRRPRPQRRHRLRRRRRTRCRSPRPNQRHGRQPPLTLQFRPLQKRRPLLAERLGIRIPYHPHRTRPRSHRTSPRTPLRRDPSRASPKKTCRHDSAATSSCPSPTSSATCSSPPAIKAKSPPDTAPSTAICAAASPSSPTSQSSMVYDLARHINDEYAKSRQDPTHPRRHHSPNPPAPNSVPIKKTRTPSHPTKSSTPSSNATSSRKKASARSSRKRFDAHTIAQRVVRLIDLSEYKRKQAGPRNQSHQPSLRLRPPNAHRPKIRPKSNPSPIPLKRPRKKQGWHASGPTSGPEACHMCPRKHPNHSHQPPTCAHTPTSKKHPTKYSATSNLPSHNP